MIEVNNLNFTYPGNNDPTVKDLNFKIKEGEIFGFLGPSGAGKSTTQKILIGILKGYSGQVSVNDTEVNIAESTFYEKIGVAFEFPNLYTKFTAIENLNFFKSLYRGETEDPMHLLEKVGLAEDANLRVSSFSKGMKMRLNFCRAFLNKPEIVFLDEPTSGLDPMNSRKIRDIILKKRDDGLTIFLTTHNMTVADEL
ncbi:MAG: ABC transporter ATP-binding protein, partial [Actinomycetia bacterium]|nr:ABC transporter ATP-binding protein [Actinomycetes bacterium]